MNMLTKFLAIALSASALTFASAASAQEAPDALVKRISDDVINTAKSDKEIQAGNINRIVALVEEKILPYVDSERMTSLAAGRYWRQATPEQQKQLITEFRSLLIYTYSGALSQIRDQKIEYKPLRADPADTEVEVRSQVIQSRGEPIQLSYRLEKLSSGWKMYDVNVMGAWLVEAYKGTFNSEITKGGIDGLIKSLSDKNKQLAARSGKK
ncbi:MULTISPECIES: ABC transporter substrate-binding protein [unclassified Herbaspirillum]|jgi:phospholipid transport system substrate-binding protein|uniref:MlaC/ttg2D family ABC transporter substrate-binding protein n=1 Tax=unclassified Herbaspirillum TaxID=2624150 RepID=UPI000E2F00D5|nr:MULTISPECIES: ABC transporter substrate-binding protein [unclassified Herbaspirillum]RFB70926.1 ABC transporter substrate-binding protein [Herbaspirillum sp. 3R-3a1]TFI08551.1 ABC transporter substrate-binding protein [Herbaspirillum sp. 3R11]TFI14965.1 ABC transporter substrate-binding protein [Herbaspirillum sp. 3R-11]TFI25190.1 ABC transporter substrate-binding protein [Herbaspirillum sp. 3C11]